MILLKHVLFLLFLKAGMTHAHGNIGRRLDDSKSLNELKFQVNEIIYRCYLNAFQVYYFCILSSIFQVWPDILFWLCVDWRLFGCGNPIEEDGLVCICSDWFTCNISDRLNRK